MNERLFWQKVDKSGSCWVWTAWKNAQGYGMFNEGPVKWKAHRLSFTLLVGPIPAAVCVLHHCDNPACVNPQHLYLGDRADNARDTSARKRWFNSRKTHCAQGHEFSQDNTFVQDGARRCRRCYSMAHAKWAAKKRNSGGNSVAELVPPL